MNDQYKLLRSWEARNLQGNVNKFLQAGWILHGSTYTYMELRNHAVTGEEYQAPMFCQAVTKSTPEPKEAPLNKKEEV